MLNPSFLKKLAKKHKERSASRRALQQLSADILAASKRSIFATQRNDATGSSKELRDGASMLQKAKALLKKDAELAHEGMWRAALEEFAEASMYHRAVAGESVGEVKELPEDAELYVGALSDLTGELTRSAVLAATKRDAASVKRYNDLVRDVVAFLLTMNLTGNSRQKFDQAKQNLRKIEEIAFTLSVNRPSK